MTHERIYDSVIIGGGPTGLFALFYACLREMDVLLVDSLEELGGQLTALYPEKDIYDVAGFPRIPARDLVAQLVEQATMHKEQDIWLGERVETYTRDEGAGVFRLTTHSGRAIVARTIILTVGIGAFAPNKLPLPGIEVLEGQSVFYFVKDKEQFRGQRVVIVGGGDSAFDWIVNLHPIAREVHLVHRRDGFRAHEDTVGKALALPGVQTHLWCELKEYAVGADGGLASVTAENNQTHERHTIGCDRLLGTLGFVANLGAIKSWGVELKGNAIPVNQRMETNIPGIFAAGDVATFPGKLKLIATGFGEAATAVNVAKKHIDPGQREQPMHSTALFEKKAAKA